MLQPGHDQAVIAASPQAESPAPGENGAFGTAPELAKRKANRATAIAACLKEWPEHAKQGKDCDEYPFSTTAEGASAAKGNFSARSLTRKDNQKAGSMLSTWFSDDRILDGDAFYVKTK